MKTTFKILVCVTLMLSMLLFGACSKNNGKDQSTDSTEASSKEESASASKDEVSSKDTSEDTSAEDASSEDEASEEPTTTDTSIVGTWYVAEYSIMFREDSTGVYCVDGQFIPIGWTVTGGRLTVIAEDSDIELPVNESYTLSEDGKTLTVGTTVYSSTPITEQKPNDDSTAILGTWYTYSSVGEGITVFNADGTGSVSGGGIEMDMTSSITNGVLTTEIDMGALLTTTTVADSYKIEDDKLTIVVDGIEEVYTRTKKQLGGNTALCGTWIEQNAPLDEFGDPDYKYSIEFTSNGTGTYTLMEDYSTVSFIWQEKNGNIIMDVYELDENTLAEKHIATVNVSFTMNSEATTLTLNDGKKATTFEFYEEEFDFDLGTDVDTEHALGGDNAIAGDWTMVQYGETINVTITKDGIFRVSDETFGNVDYKWYAEDGYIMAYYESMGIALPMLYGNYKADGDLFKIEYDGEYTVLSRKDSGKKSYCIYVYETEEDYIDTTITEVFKETNGSEYVEISYTNGIKDCKFVEYGYNKNTGKYTACTVLHDVRPLSEEEYFVAQTTIDREVSLRGIKFTSPNGDTVYLAITYDADKEAYTFVEVDPQA